MGSTTPLALYLHPALSSSRHEDFASKAFSAAVFQGSLVSDFFARTTMGYDGRNKKLLFDGMGGRTDGWMDGAEHLFSLFQQARATDRFIHHQGRKGGLGVCF
jgi:hypothetical protein